MRRMHSDRVERPAVAGRGLFLGAALCALVFATPLAAQQDSVAQDSAAAAMVEGADSVVGAAVSVSDREASLDLELSDGRTVQLELADGSVTVDGQRLGSYDGGGTLDRSWRALLEEAAMASTVELPVVLNGWDAPATAGSVGQQLDDRLEQALAGVGGRRMPASKMAASSPEDSIEQLLARIDELHEEVEDRQYYRDDDSPAEAFLHDVVEGITSFFATLIWIGVLLALGAAILFFAEGRLERVSATVREEPLRSGLIGLAGLFLALPFYVLVMLALAISILGIPLIIAWAPLFPLLLVLSTMAGWLAVAYSAGDSMVNGRLQARPLFQSAGPVKRLFVGIALLLSPFLLASIFLMTSVLEWVGGLLFGIGFVGNMLVACVGLGAVLVRGRDALDVQRERRAERRRAKLQSEAVVTEGTNV